MSQGIEVSPTRSGALGVREILRGQIAAAQSELPGARADEEGIHEARQRLKAARATLRLLRTALGEREYRAENAALRDAGRLLRPARDSVVLVRALERLVAGIDDEEARRAFERLLRELRQEARRACLEVQQQGVRRVRAQLARARARVRSSALADAGWKPVRRGLLESYRKARQGARDNRRHAGYELLHEWRKKTKSLRAQLELFAPLQNASLTRMADGLQRVSSRLGEEHDLAELAHLVRRRRRLLGAAAQALLERRIARRRRKLRKKALAAGTRAYAEKPGHFAARIRRYIRQWPQ
ncbi:MAG: CHAD domain-containing protein [Steroidobacteraceae bacterium]